MIWQIIILIVLVLSFVLQFFLSKMKNKWLGLIVPLVYFILATVFLILNLLNAFSSIEGYGIFLIEYGNSGFFALILKIGFIYTPLIIQLVIYIICRRYYKKRNGPAEGNKEFKKMIVDDLD